METVTTDLGKFGFRELKMACDLLNAYLEQGLPINFGSDGIVITMNMTSGNVFFSNEDCGVAMMNGDKLESWYSCPICGFRGFSKDMGHNEDNKECQEYLAQIKESYI